MLPDNSVNHQTSYINTGDVDYSLKCKKRKKKERKVKQIFLSLLLLCLLGPSLVLSGETSSLTIEGVLLLVCRFAGTCDLEEVMEVIVCALYVQPLSAY